VVRTDGIELRFVLDMAEIPTFQAKSQRIDTDDDGRTGEAELDAFGRSECQRLRDGVDLRRDDREVPLSVGTVALSFPPGQAGLSTLRLICVMAGPFDLTPGSRFSYRSTNFTERVGWREISASGDGVTLTGERLRPRTISAELTSYPEGLLQAPLDERELSFTAKPGGPRLTAERDGVTRPSSPLPRGVDRATTAFTSFIGRQQVSLSFGILAVGFSILLGAIHAFAPGHGKTVMAAYLVGQQGSIRQAGLIAGMVTLTHTVGVLVLGIAISASAIVAPERLYPWLGLASGLMLAVIGGGLIWRAMRLRRAGHSHSGHGHDDDHQHEHEHTHGGMTHSHGPVGRGQPITWGSLIAMGFVGGFLPSPSAVVVLLGAIALRRTWFGVVLVVAYGVGMALTLTGAGLVLLKTRGALDRRYITAERRERLAWFSRMLPIGTGVVIVVVGLFLAVQGFTKI